MYITRVMKEN